MRQEKGVLVRETEGKGWMKPTFDFPFLLQIRGFRYKSVENGETETTEKQSQSLEKNEILSNRRIIEGTK